MERKWKQPSKKTGYYKFKALQEVFDTAGNPKDAEAWMELSRMAYVVCNSFFHGRQNELKLHLDDLASIALLNGILAGKKAILRGVQTEHGWSLVFSGMRWGVSNFLARQKRLNRLETPEESAWVF